MSLQQKIKSVSEEVMGEQSVSTAKRLLQSRFGMAVIAAVSFIESALPVQVLTDPFLVAAVLLHRTKTTQIIIVTTIASVVGGICAYAMATLFLDVLIQMASPGAIEELNHLVAASNQSNTLLLTLIGAITPVPYTVVAWVVAIVEGSLLVFIVGSVLGRGLRYSIVGYTTYRFGPTAVSYAKKYLGVISLLILLFAAVYVWIKM